MPKAHEKRILVVDDEPDVRRYLSTMLEDAGFQVVTAADGDEALKIIRAAKPDFISLDLVMPRKSGHKLLYELRKDKELSRIPVLIVTAHAKDEMGKSDLQDIMENKVISGPGAYLEKPVDPQDYVRAVQRALGIEETAKEGDRSGLEKEVRDRMQEASPQALRRMLEVLRKNKPAQDGGKDS